MALLEEARPAAVATKPLRDAWADTLKVLLVVGVIVGHATMAWTDNDAWVLEEPAAREPLLTLLNLIALVGVLFAIPTFFLMAGRFTPRSFERKGLRRYLADRTLRLGIPLVFYLLALGPVVEYVDVQDNAGWGKGFPAFVAHSWLHPAPGPLWFLEVLLVFSVVYAIARTARPRPVRLAVPLRPTHLVAAGAFVAVAAYLIRIWLPFDAEWGTDLFLAQSPAWVAAFTLGALGAERGWFVDIPPAMSRALFRVAWAAVGVVVLVVSIDVGALGADIDLFFAGGTWQSAVLAVLQGTLVVAMPLWLVDVFRRRTVRQSRLLREMSRAAFVAFVVHQVVLVGAVLATRHVGWPPELEYALASVAAVIGSFGIGAVVVRLPGVSRIV